MISREQFSYKDHIWHIVNLGGIQGFQIQIIEDGGCEIVGQYRVSSSQYRSKMRLHDEFGIIDT